MTLAVAVVLAWFLPRIGFELYRIANALEKVDKDCIYTHETVTSWVFDENRGR